MATPLLFVSALLIIPSHCSEIEPWTINSTGEYYLFQDRPDDVTIRNLTCKQENCIIQCNEEESCQKFNINGGINTKNINLECDYPKQKELRPGSCWRANIKTQNAKNVDIYCTNENCAETKFYINTTNHSKIIFNGDWAGKFASIYALEMENNLNIICNDTESCSDLTVYCPSKGECNINCNGTKACLNNNIYLGSYYFDDLNLNCNYSNTSCKSLTVHCLNDESNTFWYDQIDKLWRCFDKNSNCCPFQHEYNKIKCEDDKQCIIDCDKYGSCHWAIIDASNAKSLTLKCNKDDQCKITKVICPNNGKANCNIECKGKESCKFMNISSPAISSLNIDCKSRGSCQNMLVDVIVNDNVNIECDDDWSCGNSKFEINANNDDKISNKVMKINCNGRYSCEGIQVHCPFGSKNSCLMKCNDDDSSCNGIQIFAPKEYQYDYLQIECPANPTSKLKPCNFMRVSCERDNKATVLRYINDKVQCSKKECCPWQQNIDNKKKENKKKENKGDDDKKLAYNTIVAIMCVLVSMYLLTTGCDTIFKL